MNAIQEFYLNSGEIFDVIVGDKWPFSVARAYYGSGATLTSPSQSVVRVSDGEDVTSAFWVSGSAAVGADAVVWSAFTMAAAGEYEFHLSVLVNGNKRTDVLRVKVT